LLPPNLPQDKNARRLLKLFSSLQENDKRSLLDFAEFLNSRDSQSEPSRAAAEQTPEIIPRPDKESVVSAIKRLSKSYSMLNKDELLHETSDLMSSHIIKGRPAAEVIDDLEVLFTSHYEKTLKS